jgi:Tfp pilus assembly protein PilN
MIQQINLYHAEFRKVVPRFHASLMLGSIIGVMVILGLVTGFGYWQNASRQATLSQLEQQQQQLQANLEKLRSELQNRSGNQLLLNRKDTLARELQDARRLANLLASEIERPAHPYSAYFRALAEAVVDGLWIENVVVSQAGKQIRLAGATRYPELVPQLLQALKDQPAFEGKTFAQVKMTRTNDEKETLQFEMQALREAKGDGK